MLEVPALEEVEATPQPTEPTVITTRVPASIPSTATSTQAAPVFSGTTTVIVPPQAIPDAARIVVQSVANPTQLQQAARAPGQSQEVATRTGVFAAVQVLAFDAAGSRIRTDFEEPVTISVTIPADSVPPGSDESDYTLAFWNGEDWETVDAVAVRGSDGSVRLDAQVTHFTLFAALYATGQLRPEPQYGLTMSIWTGGSVQRIRENYPGVRSIFGDTFEPSTTMLVVRDPVVTMADDPERTRGASAQVQGTGRLSVSPAVGVTLAVWSGGELHDPARNYPLVQAIWLVYNGRFCGYQYGVPAFVNRTFMDLFGTNLPSGTPMLVVR